MFNIFKKKKKEPEENENIIRKKNLFDTNIYCEILWSEKEPFKVFLYGINKINNIRSFCGDLYHNQFFHTSQPLEHIYIPRILYDIDWAFILKNDNEITNIKSFKITFANYSASVRNYTVILEAINRNDQKISDSFMSTKKVFIDPWELTENIYKFLKFAENYK